MKSLSATCLFVLALAGCSPNNGGGGDGRVTAVVNGVEITRREVDFLCRRPALRDSDGVAERQRVLSLLVRKELLAQHALALKLENSPDFIVAMYEARRNVLAGMAERHIAAQSEKVLPESVEKIVAANPRFFSQRKLLVYDQVVIPSVDEPLLTSLNNDAESGASLEQLLNRINAKKIPFRRTMQALTTDQIDPGIFSVLSTSRLKKPRIVRIETKFSMILVLRATVPMPLDGDAAIQAAADMLNEQQRKMEVSKTLTKALDSAKITFFGEFASDKGGKKLPVTSFDLPPLPLLQP